MHEIAMDGWHSRGGFSSTQEDLAFRYVTACSSNDIPAVTTLLDDCGVPVDSGESGCCGHYPAVLGACKLGHAELVVFLLQRNAIPEHQDCDGFQGNPIFSCADRKRKGSGGARNDAVIAALVEHYYAPKCWNRDVSDVWTGAVGGGLSTLAEVRARDWWNRGKQGSKFSAEDLCALLMFCGVEEHLAPTLLHEVVEGGDLGGVRRILGDGVAVRKLVNRENFCGETPLVSAADRYWQEPGEEWRSNMLGIMRSLLEAGAMLGGAEEEGSVLENCWWGYLGQLGPDEAGGDKAEEDAAFLATLPAELLRGARRKHPHRVRAALDRLRRVVPAVGKVAIVLQRVYEEVSLRPGNTGMMRAKRDFERRAARGDGDESGGGGGGGGGGAVGGGGGGGGASEGSVLPAPSAPPTTVNA